MFTGSAGTAEPASSLYRLAQFTSKDEIAHAVLVIFTVHSRPALVYNCSNKLNGSIGPSRRYRLWV